MSAGDKQSQPGDTFFVYLSHNHKSEFHAENRAQKLGPVPENTPLLYRDSEDSRSSNLASPGGIVM